MGNAMRHRGPDDHGAFCDGTVGLGIGVDRVMMMLTGQNIRATLAFPFVRPTPRD